MCEQQFQAEVMDELAMKQEYDYLRGQGFIDWLYKQVPIGNGHQLVEAMENPDLYESYLIEVGLPLDTELEY